MESEKLVAFVALGWLIGAVLLMARSVRRGRELAEVFAARHPERYAAFGRPRPGFLYSVRRNRFGQFLARREFEQLGDPELAARFEDYRKAETRLVLLVLASMVVVALLGLAVRYGG